MCTLKELIRQYYLRFCYFRLHPDNIPASFRRCWDYPYIKLDANQRPPAVSGSCIGNVIVYPMNDWHTRIQRSQQLAKALTRQGYRSLYINPHLGRQFETLYPLDSKHRISFIENHLLELHIRVPCEPVFHNRMLTKRESDRAAEAVKQALRLFKDGPGVQIVNLPIWLDTAIYIRDKYGYPILYDCHDLLSGFSNYSQDIQDSENRLLAHSDAVIFSSTYLLKHHSSISGNISEKSIILRNAIDDELIERTGAHRIQSSRPVIGYIGAIDYWFDISAVKHAAQQLKHCDFQIYGKLDNNLAKTELQLSNIKLMGELEYTELRRVLAGFDVGIIPFKVNDLTLSTNPIKLYEYFGFGMPVVSAALPEVMAYDELVYVSRSSEDFGAQLKTALEESNPVLRTKRLQVASEETWQNRGSVLHELINRLWQARRA